MSFVQLVVNTADLVEGKFYQVYTDSNGTTLLVPKDNIDQLEADVESLKTTQNSLLADMIQVKNTQSGILNSLQTLEGSNNDLTDSVNNLVNVTNTLSNKVTELEEKNANPVIVNVNNNTGCCPTPEPSSEWKTVTVGEQTEQDIVLTELSANAVTVKYLLYRNKEMEMGTLNILDAEELVIDEDRILNNSLLPVTFSVNRNNDTLNLHLSFITLGSYKFKYKIEVL